MSLSEEVHQVYHEATVFLRKQILTELSNGNGHYMHLKSPNTRGHALVPSAQMRLRPSILVRPPFVEGNGSRHFYVGRDEVGLMIHANPHDYDNFEKGFGDESDGKTSYRGIYGRFVEDFPMVQLFAQELHQRHESFHRRFIDGDYVGLTQTYLTILNSITGRIKAFIEEGHDTEEFPIPSKRTPLHPADIIARRVY